MYHFIIKNTLNTTTKKMNKINKWKKSISTDQYSFRNEYQATIKKKKKNCSPRNPETSTHIRYFSIPHNLIKRREKETREQRNAISRRLISEADRDIIIQSGERRPRSNSAVSLSREERRITVCA